MNLIPKETVRYRLYDHPQWRKYSKLFLRKNPFCVDPYGRHPGVVKISEVTDHIVKHEGNPALFWDRTNHQALCKNECHNWKSRQEQLGFVFTKDGRVQGADTRAFSSLDRNGRIVTDPTKIERSGR